MRLRPADAHPAIPLGQIAIAEIINRNGDRTFFAETGFVLPGRGFIPYDDVKSATMPARCGNRSGSKRNEFDHVQFVLRDGSSTILTSIGPPAAFGCGLDLAATAGTVRGAVVTLEAPGGSSGSLRPRRSRGKAC